MDNGLVSIYLSRILSGSYIFICDNTRYKLIYPDINTKYNAELYAQEEYDKNKFNDWITDDSIVDILVSLGLWSYTGDQDLANVEKQIEDYKVELFKNFLNPSRIKQFRKSLDNLKKTYAKLFELRHSFDYLTPTGFSNMMKNQYLLIHSIHDINNSIIFNDWDNLDYTLLNNISNTINENTIDIATFRSIARSENWRSYWSANKEHIFDKATINWTDEQKTLVVLSKMYDSAYEHPECPPDKVIEDDDIFDGWMILQRRENEKNRDKNRTEKALSDKKLGKAGEVFLVANSKEEAEAIYNLNDSTSRNIIRERSTVLSKTKQDVKESDLPDVQRNLVMENNRLFMQARKK